MAQVILERGHLLRTLSAALQHGHVLVSAPAGYGKSSLLRRFVSERPHSVYVPLTPADADLPHLQSHLSPLLASSAVVVLDDVHHTAESQEVAQWLIGQLAKPSPGLIISGRHLPFDPDALPPTIIQRLSAGNLAFSAAETAAVLSQAFSISGSDVASWHKRTGGWPLAVGMVARQARLMEAADLSQMALFAYLTQTLLAGLPESVRRYVSLTGLAVRFDDALAADLLAGDSLSADAARLRSEVERRNLFIEPAQKPGWFRYHDLIHEFLLHQEAADAGSYHQRMIAWFDSSGDLEAAIEQALAGGLEAQAAALIERVPPDLVRRDHRYLTYRRWVMGLSDLTLEAKPGLRLQLGAFLHNLAGFREEAWRHVHIVAEAASRSQNEALARAVRIHTGFMHYREGRYAEALALAETLLADDGCREQERSLALRLAGVTLGEMARFQEARRAYTEALELAVSRGDEDELHFSRNNLALTVLIPLGELDEAARHLQAEIDHFAGSPGPQLRSLTAWCDLCTARGDWAGLASSLAEWERLQSLLEIEETGDLLWLNFYRAILATGQRRFPDAWRFASQMYEPAGQRPMAVLSLAWLETRLLRLEGRRAEAVALATIFLDQSSQSLFWRSSLALDRDIALGLSEGLGKRPWLHPETRRLIDWRARSELLRLRALLTVVCWRQGDPRWRRHAYAALAHLSDHNYQTILTDRDPDLGAAFWSVLLAEDIAATQAKEALRRIGEPSALTPLLHDTRPDVRMRAAEALALLEREEAMPALAAALTSERDPSAARALETALARLEGLPPARLRVRLMGEFAVWRGDQPIPLQAWYRPVVRRLFQYFALHRGQPLSKDRILEDLWPGSTPEHGSTAFRTAYSRLRQTLDPFMPAKGPARYFAVSGDSYRFDPDDRVDVDVEAFEVAVRAALRAAEREDITPVSPSLLEALEAWATLLPDLPYEEWLLEARERLQIHYVDGCLVAANTFFARGQLGQAVLWARRAIETAPWLEQGYQLLMRAYARQGQRASALKTFQTACRALQQELGIEPSPLTRWLAERLERGEDI